MRHKCRSQEPLATIKQLLRRPLATVKLLLRRPLATVKRVRGRSFPRLGSRNWHNYIFMPIYHSSWSKSFILYLVASYLYQVHLHYYVPSGLNTINFPIMAQVNSDCRGSCHFTKFSLLIALSHNRIPMFLENQLKIV